MPRDGETKPCPKECGKNAVFNSQTRVPDQGWFSDAKKGGGAAPELRYEPAWKCENLDCDFYEPVSE
jgi:hypothetical protein